ncbi:hypothetical protein THAOC_34183 [Thalassiosira oceanica]|uniref:Uncharacterized protein n=1 Tax=Thalassiosira oceanica TaxID=159749 RepID=K0R2Y0_THAOC|nr:hypothetical protein THAOC_34183 [Thalassiosira oceanica]|eukprot:EJK47118.1 hypothetical protein THAOC_34183 [Thalassiosira oceanica]
MDVGDGANASVSAGDVRRGVPPPPPPQTQQQPLSRDETLALLAFPVSSAVGTSASDSHSTLDPETTFWLIAIGGVGAPTLPEQNLCRANQWREAWFVPRPRDGQRQDNRSNGGKPRQRLNEPEADSAASCSVCALAPRPTDGHLSDGRFLETFFAARPTSQRSDERTSEVARR